MKYVYKTFAILFFYFKITDIGKFSSNLHFIVLIYFRRFYFVRLFYIDYVH